MNIFLNNSKILKFAATACSRVAVARLMRGSGRLDLCEEIISYGGILKGT